MTRQPAALAMLIALALALPADAAIIEDYQLNDAIGAGLADVVNGADATGQLGGNADNVATNGAGSLVFTQGIDAGDNVFRNSTPSRGISTGSILFSTAFDSANLSDATGGTTNVGFGIRGAGNNDVLIRLSEQGSGDVQLQARFANAGGGNTNENLVNLGSGLLGPIEVEALLNFDDDTLNIIYDIGGGPIAAGPFPLRADQDFDSLRLAVNTNNADFGATDFVNVDYLTVQTVIPEPASLALLGLSGFGLIGRRRRNG